MLKGSKMSEEAKRKIGLANSKLLKGKMPKNIKQLIECNKDPEHRRRHSEFMKGKKYKLGSKGYVSWNYIDGRSKLTSPGRYGDDWDKIRYLVYKRDGFRCQFCGINGVPLHVHHKIPFMISRDNSPENLISLCASCHRKEDARIIKEMKGGMKNL